MEPEHKTNVLTDKPLSPKEARMVLLLSGVITLAVLVVATSIFLKGRQGSQVVDAGKLVAAEAIVLCRNAVREQIKNPSTAEFSTPPEALPTREGFTFSESFKTQNDFGVMQDVQYDCVVTGQRDEDATASITVK